MPSCFAARLNPAIAALAAIVAHALVVASALGQVAPPEHATGSASNEGAVVTATGRLTVLYADDFANQRAQRLYLLEDRQGGRSFWLRFEHEPAVPPESGVWLTVTGRATDSEIIVSAGDGSLTLAPDSDARASTVVTSSSGEQRTLVIVANFSDTSVSCPIGVIHNIMFSDPTGLSVDALYRETSLGRVWFSGTVVGPYGIDAASSDPCDISGWAVAAEAEAAAAGVDLTAYPRKVYVMPTTSTCPGAGFGTVGNTPSGAWVFTCDLRGVYAHELGHNLGMDHASTPGSEYGDTTDPMAFGSPQLRGANAPHREQLDWLGTAATQTVSEDGVYNIAPLALDPASVTTPQVLRIGKPDTLEYYYLSYRRALGFDSYVDGSYLNRLSVHRYKGDGSSTRTWLVAALSDGQSFVDDANGLTVTLVNHGATYATAQVGFRQTPCTSQAPDVSLSPAARSGEPGTAVSYDAVVMNRDVGGCGASTFNLNSTVPTSWSGTLVPAAVTLGPGGTAHATFTVASAADAVAGTYPVSIRAVAVGTPVHDASAPASYAVTAPCVPTSPLVSPIPVTRQGTPGTPVTYTLSIANRDSAACTASAFQLQASIPPGWSGAASPPSVVLGPGQSDNVTLAITSGSGAVPGDYTITAQLTDASQPAHATSAAMTYSVQAPADSSPPSAPAGLTATASQKLKQVRLVWRASVDNIGVAGYRVFRNGLLAGSPSSNGWVDTAWSNGATITYFVVAYDAVGNVSAPSNSVAVAMGSGGGGKPKQ